MNPCRIIKIILHYFHDNLSMYIIIPVSFCTCYLYITDSFFLLRFLLVLFHWFLWFLHLFYVLLLFFHFLDLLLLDFYLFVFCQSLFSLIYVSFSSSSALSESRVSFLQEPEVWKGPVSEAPGNFATSRSLGFTFIIIIIINPPEQRVP